MGATDASVINILIKKHFQISISDKCHFCADYLFYFIFNLFIIILSNWFRGVLLAVEEKKKSMSADFVTFSSR